MNDIKVIKFSNIDVTEIYVNKNLPWPGKITIAPLFDLSLSAETFPKIFKNSEITQIHKKTTQNENVQTIDQFSSYQILINS